MTTDDLNLEEYCAAHKTRVRGHEDGYVDVTGKRVKKWRGWYHVYIKKADGTETRIKRKRIISEYSKMTKAEAREEHRAWIRRLNVQPVADTRACLVSHLCDDYLAMREGDWEENTRATNRGLFERIIKPAIGNRAIETVTAEDLKRLVNSLPNRKWLTPKGKVKAGISRSYAGKTITMLRAIFDLAQERDLIRKNPARSITVRLKMPKQARKPDKNVFPPEHLPAFLAELSTRDSLIVWISMLGATRPGELFAVKGADVGPNWIHIKRALSPTRKFKETKTDTQRMIYLPPDTAGELHRWLRENKIGPEDLVFPNRDGNAINIKNFVRRHLRPAAKRANIPVPDVDFQMLRRSFGTLGQVAGCDIKVVQSQLGHARPDMSATEYMQPVDALRMEQITRLEQMLRGKVPMPADISAKLGSVMVQ